MHPQLNCWSWSLSFGFSPSLMMGNLSSQHVDGRQPCPQQPFLWRGWLCGSVGLTESQESEKKCSIVPSGKQKPKIKFRDILTTWTSFNSFWSSLFIDLCSSVGEKSLVSCIFSPRKVHHHCTLGRSIYFSLKTRNNIVLVSSILFPLFLASPIYSVVLHQRLQWANTTSSPHTQEQ